VLALSLPFESEPYSQISDYAFAQAEALIYVELRSFDSGFKNDLYVARDTYSENHCSYIPTYVCSTTGIS
jgi:hypothetical protein